MSDIPALFLNQVFSELLFTQGEIVLFQNIMGRSSLLLTMEKIVIDNRMNQIYQETSARNKN